MRFIIKIVLSLQQKLKNTRPMKKIALSLLLFSALTLNACNGNSGEGSGSTATASGEGKVAALTAESFRTLVWDYQASPKTWVFKGDVPVIIDFYADWCRPCKMVAPIMDQLASEYKGKLKIYKINTDQQRELAGLFNITSIPAILFVPKNGQPQMSVGAMQKEGYVDVINKVLNVK